MNTFKYEYTFKHNNEFILNNKTTNRIMIKPRKRLKKVNTFTCVAKVEIWLEGLEVSGTWGRSYASCKGCCKCRVLGAFLLLTLYMGNSLKNYLYRSLCCYLILYC